MVGDYPSRDGNNNDPAYLKYLEEEYLTSRDTMHKPGDLDSISRRLEALENRPVIATYTPGTSKPKGAVGLQARGTPHAQPGGTTLQPGSGVVCSE